MFYFSEHAKYEEKTFKPYTLLMEYLVGGTFNHSTITITSLTTVPNSVEYGIMEDAINSFVSFFLLQIHRWRIETEGGSLQF